LRGIDTNLLRRSSASFETSFYFELCCIDSRKLMPEVSSIVRLGREGAHGAPGVLAAVDDLVKAWVSSLIPLGTTLQVAGQIFLRPARNDRSNPIASAARLTLLSASSHMRVYDRAIGGRTITWRSLTFF
jgi:hypothetical protein